MKTNKSLNDPDRNAKFRSRARRVYFLSNKPLICIICGYSKHCEICHIKPLKKFNKQNIHTANDINNLIALCPNHHYLFDMGILKIPDVSTHVFDNHSTVRFCECGKRIEIKNKTGFCINCLNSKKVQLNSHLRKVKRPNDQDLLSMKKIYTSRQLAEIYKVSQPTIMRWIKYAKINQEV